MLEKKSAISEICQNSLPNSLSSVISQDGTGSRTQSAASGDAEEQGQPGQPGPDRPGSKGRTRSIRNFLLTASEPHPSHTGAE